MVNDCFGPMAASFSSSVDFLLVFQSRPDFSLLLFEGHLFKSRRAIDRRVNDLSWSVSNQVFLVLTDFSILQYSPKCDEISREFSSNLFQGIQWSLSTDWDRCFVLLKSNLSIDERDLKIPFNKRRTRKREEFFDEKRDRTVDSIRIDPKKRIREKNDAQIRSSTVACFSSVFLGFIMKSRHVHRTERFRLAR